MLLLAWNRLCYLTVRASGCAVWTWFLCFASGCAVLTSGCAVLTCSSRRRSKHTTKRAMKRTADEAALSMVPQRIRVNVIVPPVPITNNQEMHFHLNCRLSEADFSKSDIHNPWSMPAHFIISASAGWTSRGFYYLSWPWARSCPSIRPYSSGPAARSFSARISRKLLRVFSTCICLFVVHAFVCWSVITYITTIWGTTVAVFVQSSISRC